MGPEASGFKQTPRDLVSEVPEAERRAAEVLEPSVDRLCRSVRCAGQVEEREHVDRALLQIPAETSDLDEHGRDAAADGVDHGAHQLLRLLLVGLSVGVHDALVDAPGRLDLDVLFDREDRFEAGVLLVGEQAGPGMQSPACLVERIVGAAAMPERVLLHPLPAAVQSSASPARRTTWNGSITGTA